MRLTNPLRNRKADVLPHNRLSEDIIILSSQFRHTSEVSLTLPRTSPYDTTVMPI